MRYLYLILVLVVCTPAYALEMPAEPAAAEVESIQFLNKNDRKKL